MLRRHRGGLIGVCGVADNVYGVLPPSRARDGSIVIMLIHQIVAYALCEAPYSEQDISAALQQGPTNVCLRVHCHFCLGKLLCLRVSTRCQSNHSDSACRHAAVPSSLFLDLATFYSCVFSHNERCANGLSCCRCDSCLLYV